MYIAAIYMYIANSDELINFNVTINIWLDILPLEIVSFGQIFVFIFFKLKLG